MPADPVSEIASGLSRNARKSINDGDNHDWYGLTERASEELAKKGLAWLPFTHDRKIMAPTVLGLAVRDHLLKEQNNG